MSFQPTRVEDVEKSVRVYGQDASRETGVPGERRPLDRSISLIILGAFLR